MAAKRLTARGVESETKTGYHGDAASPGLFLQVRGKPSRLSKSWVFRYTSPLTGKRRDMGLGQLAVVGLAEARELCQEARGQLGKQLDPKVTRDESREAGRAKAATTITFNQAAAACIAAKSPEFSNPKHIQQWTNTIATYAGPVIGQLNVATVTPAHVYAILSPIWATKTETATRLRQRIEAVMDWATAWGYYSGYNPAGLKGNLAHKLPKASKIKKVRHHPAVPYQQGYEFTQALRSKQGMTAKALEVLLLSGLRTDAVLGGCWDEVDFINQIWTIPKERVKGQKNRKRPFALPLSSQLTSILSQLASNKTGAFIFWSPARKTHQPLSTNAMRKLMQGMSEFNEYVPHGLRSTFRQWSAARTAFDHNALEASLQHVIKNQSEASYQRDDLIDKRRIIMQCWADFLDTPPASASNGVQNVTPIMALA